MLETTQENMAEEKEQFWKPQEKNVCYNKWKNWYIYWLQLCENKEKPG